MCKFFSREAVGLPPLAVIAVLACIVCLAGMYASLVFDTNGTSDLKFEVVLMFCLSVAIFSMRRDADF